MSVVDPLYKAVFDGDCDKLDAMLAERDVNIKTKLEKWNLLHMALIGVTRSSNPNTVRHLIKIGVDVNAKDYCGWTPLHFAARSRGPDANTVDATGCVQLLIDAGADVNAETNGGVTPLHESFLKLPWNMELTEALLAAGAKKTKIFEGFLNAVAGPDKEKLLTLLETYASNCDLLVLTEAVTLWTGWGRQSSPSRDDSAVIQHFGFDIANRLLPIVKSLEEEFYLTGAKNFVRDLEELGRVAIQDFKKRNPQVPEDIAKALAWCYTFDFR